MLKQNVNGFSKLNGRAYLTLGEIKNMDKIKQEASLYGKAILAYVKTNLHPRMIIHAQLDYFYKEEEFKVTLTEIIEGRPSIVFNQVFNDTEREEALHKLYEIMNEHKRPMCQKEA